MFISFEGVDGCGKSTQARLLVEALRATGRTVRLTREPGGSPGAEAIRRLLVEGGADRWSAETECLLFTAARRDHVERLIRPALAAGETVVTDRFADSTRVYQGAARADLRAMVDALHALSIGLEPDRTFVLDLDPAEALARAEARAARAAAAAATTATAALASAAAAAAGASGLVEVAGIVALTGEDRFERFGLAFQQRLREGFLALAASEPDRIRVIDAAGPPEAVAARIQAAL